MTAEELAYEMAVQYGRAPLGDRHQYGDWLWWANLPCDEDSVEEFEKMHAVALEELRIDNE